jgi:DNA-binding winged helix-turn-helix (wHTH) protein/TolB-like protein/Tfp pilus assembly protein PilF
MINGHSPLREFGDFRLDLEKKLLWLGPEPVAMPPKAVELLCVLVERGGQVVSKDEIWHEVWNDAFLEETNLTHYVYLLRKTFKDHGQPELIKTVPRRGYRFTGDVREIPDAEVVIERHSLTRTLIEDVSVPAPVPAVSHRTNERHAFYRNLSIISLAAAALLVVGLGAYYGSSNSSGTKTVHSLAVLPLATVDEGNDHQGLGLADILITRLSGLKEITVRPTSSVLEFENQQTDSVTVGKKLGVDGVLEGTIYRTDDSVRVTMRLVSVESGKTLWSGEFEKPVQDELRLQDEIAVRVASALAPDLDPAERRSLAKRYTDNRDAYESYLRGRFFFDKREGPAYEKAVAEYQHAIQLDPTYALAYSGLGDVYAMQAIGADDADRNAAYDKAKAATIKALELDDELAEAHTSLAWIKRTHEWDWAGSEREFKRAIELNPNYCNAHMWYSLLLLTEGRKDESLAEMEKARELQPLIPAVIANYATVEDYRGDYEALPQLADEMAKLGARDYSVTQMSSSAFLRSKNYQKVIDTINEFEARNGGRVYHTLLSTLATAYALSGQPREAQQALAPLEEAARSDGEAAYRLALVYAAIGRNDDAIRQLQKCVDTRDDRLMWIKVEPRFDRLRDDKRFQELISTMGLASDL